MKKAEVPLEVCPTCGATMKLVTGTVEYTVNSSVVLVPDHAYLLCSTCGEKLFNLSQLGAAARGIYRSERDLLSPVDIRRVRETAQLGVQAMAILMDVAASEWRKWEEGQRVQTPTQDLVLRLLRDVPGSLDYLRRRRAA